MDTTATQRYVAFIGPELDPARWVPLVTPTVDGGEWVYREPGAVTTVSAGGRADRGAAVHPQPRFAAVSRQCQASADVGGGAARSRERIGELLGREGRPEAQRQPGRLPGRFRDLQPGQHGRPDFGDLRAGSACPACSTRTPSRM
jgi:hypothetical protein